MEERFDVESRIEAAESHPRWLITAVAITTAVFAVLAAYGSFAGGEAVHRSLASLTEAALLQNQASDQWAFYQAEGIKRHIFEVQRDALRLGGTPQGVALAARYDADASRYAVDQRKISGDAAALERRRDGARVVAERYDALHGLFGRSVALFQVGIVMCSVAAIVRRPALWYGALGAGALAAALLAQGLFRPGPGAAAG